MVVRCFISIELDEYIKRKISELIDFLRKYEADIKWVEPENLHLTLKFLGNTQLEKIQIIKEVLTNISKKIFPFYIKIQGIGFFPNKKYPRVLWVGLENKEKIIDIQKKIEADMSKIGYKKEEREFDPHITIGRTRSFTKISNLLECLDDYKKYDFGTLFVDRINIMKSDLTSKGPIYTKLTDVIFNKWRENDKQR